MKTIQMTLLVACMTALTGCLSLVSVPNTQNISLTSRQPHVKIYVNGHYVGDTPQTIEYDRRIQPCVVLAKEGYEPCQLRIRRQATASAHFEGLLTLIPYVNVVGNFALFDFCRPGCLVEYAATQVTIDLEERSGPVLPDKEVALWDYRALEEINDHDRQKGIPQL